MKFNERLRALRIKNSLTQKDLSTLVGVSIVSVGSWESGTKKPSSEAIISLAKSFNVSTDYLLGVSVEADKDEQLLSQSEKTLLSNYRLLDNHGRKVVDTVCVLEKSRIESLHEPSVNRDNIVPVTRKPTRYIPRYSTPAAAGLSVPLDGDDFEMIPVNDSIPGDADFAVGIQGNSMYPYIHDGDTVYIKKASELAVGDVGIFSVDGAMYCKQYYLDESGNLMLLSANPRLKHTNVYVNVESGTDVRCYGKVLLGFKVDLPDYIYED